MADAAPEAEKPATEKVPGKSAAAGSKKAAAKTPGAQERGAQPRHAESKAHERAATKTHAQATSKKHEHAAPKTHAAPTKHERAAPQPHAHAASKHEHAAAKTKGHAAPTTHERAATKTHERAATKTHEHAAPTKHEHAASNAHEYAASKKHVAAPTKKHAGAHVEREPQKPHVSAQETQVAEAVVHPETRGVAPTGKEHRASHAAIAEAGTRTQREAELRSAAALEAIDSGAIETDVEVPAPPAKHTVRAAPAATELAAELEAIDAEGEAVSETIPAVDSVKAREQVAPAFEFPRRPALPRPEAAANFVTQEPPRPAAEPGERPQAGAVSAPQLPGGEARAITRSAPQAALATAIGVASGLVKALRAGLGSSGAVELDSYGKDHSLAQSIGPLGNFLYEKYFRVVVDGAERIPEGAVILVANHSGALPIDGPVLHEALRRERPELHEARWLVEDQVFFAPVLGTLLNRLGAVRANPENALRLLSEQRPLIVFPEGIHGLQKPFSERYQLKRFGRGGFVKIALQTGAPIVPVAIVGAEESAPLLARLPGKFLGLPYLPLTPLGPVPLPAKWFIRFGAPITVDDLNAAGEDETLQVQRGTDLTREAIQGMLHAMLSERESVFR